MHSIHFLDTTVKRDRGKNRLYTDLYCKPTDSHNYLRYDSSHPPNTIKSLPYSQLVCLKRICTRPEDYTRHSVELMKHFQSRGYPKTILNAAKTKSAHLTQKDLIDAQKPKEPNPGNLDTTYLVNTFRPCKNSLTETIRKNWDILGRSKTTKSLYRSNLVTSYKRPKNIRDYLVKARTNFNPDTTSNLKIENTMKNRNECTKSNCKYCKMISKSGEIDNQSTKRRVITKHNVTCNSSNLIYCISCDQCNIKYIGQTKRKIKERLREHIYHINRKHATSDVTHHFNLEGHGIDNLKVHIVDFIYEHPDSKRAQKLRNTIEFNWIHKLHTQAPNGLNTLDNRYG